MYLEQLKYFADLAKTDSMNLTAQRMFVTQPTISEAIKRLERELDCTLLIRSNSGIESFTEDGKEVLKFAQEVLAGYDRLMRYLQEKYKRDQLYGDLTIGVGYGIGSSLLLPLTLKCNRAYPGVRIRVIEGWQQTLLSLLDSGELDFVLIGLAEPAKLFAENAFMKDVSYLELFQDPVVCAMHKNHPYSSLKALTIEQLGGVPVTCFSEVEGIVHTSFYHVSTNIDIHRQLMYEKNTICCMPYQVYLSQLTDKNIIYRPLLESASSTVYNYLFYRTAAFAEHETLYREFIATVKSIVPQSGERDAETD